MDDTRHDNARQAALDYHEFPRPGKLEIRPTKPLANGRDLARAYTPGVAEACLEIKADPAAARRFTARGNLVAVVTNGTAVLGLGNIGALAAKPVMEGKAVLFKKFANIDCFDIELNESDPERLADIALAAPEREAGTDAQPVHDLSHLNASLELRDDREPRLRERVARKIADSGLIVCGANVDPATL